MAFLKALGSFWTTPQQPAAPSLVPSTSPLARLSRTEQRDQLLDQLAELDAELAADEEVLLVRRDGNTFYAERRDNPLLSL